MVVPDQHISNSFRNINSDHQSIEPTSDNIQNVSFEELEPLEPIYEDLVELNNTEMTNIHEDHEYASSFESFQPPAKRPRNEFKSPELSECCTSPGSTSEYVDAKEKFDSPRTLEHAGLVLCYLENSIEITTESGEKITVKKRATTINSGPCQIDIKNGVLRLQTVEMDSLFNFQAPAV